MKLREYFSILGSRKTPEERTDWGGTVKLYSFQQKSQLLRERPAKGSIPGVAPILLRRDKGDKGNSNEKEKCICWHWDAPPAKPFTAD